ncbi:transcription factor mef2A-like [Stylophora pistillata]|uniref:transcription factor mef2A-like n=1 Tax=Stylophora pistillata TaxID=50429 RepID=UPI000C050EAA|nr:transcription factor mef2A-like [Stylophora pistillata]XP_022793978.1 transcription factor mef2A-like [Stylophora pistillata]XP_022793979.1 transcription factor mef2A-like [Stylophora pistillata]
MEHVHEEQNRSSPRLSSKYSGLPLDHRARREKGTRVHTHLNGYANHLSNSEDQDEHGIKDSNNNVSNCNDDHSRGGGGGDDNDDDGVSRNSEENSDNSDDDRGNGDKDDENCDENCDSKYHNDDGGNTSHNVEDDFTCNNGGCAKSHTIQAPLSPNADETTVGSDETEESLTEELNVSLRFNSQHSIDEDTGNFSVENSNRNPVGSNSINSNNDTSCENPNTRNDKKKANRFEVRNNAERSAERDGIAASQGARPKIVPQNPVLFDAHYQNGKIPSLETTGIDQIFLARHSTDPSLPQISFTESYDMYTSND